MHFSFMYENSDLREKYSNLTPNICCTSALLLYIIWCWDNPLSWYWYSSDLSQHYSRAPLNSWNLNTSPLTTTGTGRHQQPDWLINLPTIVSHSPWRLMAHHLDMGFWDEDFKWSVSEIGKWRIEERGYKKLFWQNSGDIASRKVRSFFFWCWNFSV